MANHAETAPARLPRAAWLLPALVFTAACAVSSPFTVNSTGTGVPAQASISLAGEETAGTHRASLHSALQRAFATEAVTLSDDGKYLADFSISIRNAEGGLTTSIEAKDEAEIDWETKPRDSRLLDGCDAKRMRATLVVLDRATGQRIYRGEGEATECDFSGDAMDGVARQLVRDALSRGRG